VRPLEPPDPVQPFEDVDPDGEIESAEPVQPVGETSPPAEEPEQPVGETSPPAGETEPRVGEPGSPAGASEPDVVAAAPMPALTPRLSRRQARLAARRQRRHRIGLLGLVVIVVVVAVVLAGVGFGVHTAVTHHTSAPASSGQSSVLLQVQGSDGTATRSVLLAHDADQGLELLVPSRVLTDVCGYGQQAFGDVLALPNGTTVSRQALSSLLGGVRIGGSWVLTTAQLAQLVSAVGHVTVNVDVDVVRQTPGGGGVVLVPKGTAESLDGTQAAEFATYVASPSEDASAGLARLQEVVDATIRALPRSPAAVQALLAKLGAGGASTLGAASLATLLAGLASNDRQSGGVLPTDLPTTPIESGGATPSYGIDTAGVDKLVDSRLRGSLPGGRRQTLPSVYVENGLGTPGLVESACARLQAAGFDYAGSGNAPSFGNGPSRVDVFSDAPPTLAQGYRLAKALGLSSGDVERSEQNQNVADLFVVLGSDYKP
jgi:hypothetical protein